MADREELYTALRNADAAGDTQGAQTLAKYIQSLPADEPAAVSAGKALNGIPRQLGLTARYALEGPAQAAQIVTEPLRTLVTDPVLKLFGGGPSKPLGQVASGAADAMGLPSPEGANERVVGDATRMLAGTGLTVGLGGLASKLAGMPGQIGSFFAANPAQQLVGAGLAGGAAGASREAGGSPLQQALVGAAGGVAGGYIPSLASASAGLVRRAVSPAMTDMQIDARLTPMFSAQQVDYSLIPERTRQALRAETRTALQSGKEINPDALRRLADFQTAGLTPTRGMLTQDPVQITREQNLAKIGANSADGQLHGLPLLQNRNNSAAIGNLNGAGAARGDQFGAGERAIGGVRAEDARQSANVDSLYAAARAQAGGDIPIQRAPIINNIFDSLARENRMAFLPSDIGSMLNNIARGSITVEGRTHAVPFNAQTVDTLKTMIATAQRGTQDGNVKAALKLARDAIDSAPFNVEKTAIGGNQVLTPEMAARLTAHDGQPASFMDALNQARAAARSRFGWQESSMPVERALGGAQPDKFFQQHVITGSVADTRAFLEHAGPQATRDAVLAFLKEKALNSASDEVGKFSQSAFNKALTTLGDRKLAAIFEPEQLTQLRALGRATSYAQAQPVGSAVNNSNSGALVLGRAYDFLKNGVSLLPGVGPLGAGALDLTIGQPTRNAASWLAQRQARDIPASLLAAPPVGPMGARLVGPATAAGGLLAAPGTQ
ncbi:MAG: hypothetical protein V4505_25570 [Pseudomonadota bacterium]